MMEKKFFRQGIFSFLILLVTFFSFSEAEGALKQEAEKEYFGEVLSEQQKVHSLSLNILAAINTPIGIFTTHVDTKEVLKPMWAKGEVTSSLETFSGLTKEMKYPFYLEESDKNLHFYYQNAKHEWKKSTLPLDKAMLEYASLNADFLDCVEKVTLLSETEERKTLRVSLAGDKMAKLIEKKLIHFLPKDEQDKRRLFLLELNKDFFNKLEEDYTIDKKTKRIVKISLNLTKSLQGFAHKFLDKFGAKLVAKDRELIQTIIDLSVVQVEMQVSEYDVIKKEKLPKEVLKAKEEQRMSL